MKKNNSNSVFSSLRRVSVSIAGHDILSSSEKKSLLFLLSRIFDQIEELKKAQETKNRISISSSFSSSRIQSAKSSLSNLYDFEEDDKIEEEVAEGVTVEDQMKLYIEILELKNKLKTQKESFNEEREKMSNDIRRELRKKSQALLRKEKELAEREKTLEERTKTLENLENHFINEKLRLKFSKKSTASDKISTTSTKHSSYFFDDLQ